jgi:hypothetical protein
MDIIVGKYKPRYAFQLDILKAITTNLTIPQGWFSVYDKDITSYAVWSSQLYVLPQHYADDELGSYDVSFVDVVFKYEFWPLMERFLKEGVEAIEPVGEKQLEDDYNNEKLETMVVVENIKDWLNGNGCREAYKPAYPTDKSEEEQKVRTWYYRAVHCNGLNYVGP